MLPCYGSSTCDCIRGWNVIQMSDINDVCDNMIKSHVNTFILNYRCKEMKSINMAVNQSFHLSLRHVILELP